MKKTHSPVLRWNINKTLIFYYHVTSLYLYSFYKINGSLRCCSAVASLPRPFFLLWMITFSVLSFFKIASNDSCCRECITWIYVEADMGNSVWIGDTQVVVAWFWVTRLQLCHRDNLFPAVWVQLFNKNSYWVLFPQKHRL